MGLFNHHFGGKDKIPHKYKEGTSDNPLSGKFTKPGKDFVGKEELPDSGLNPEELLLAKEDAKQDEYEKTCVIDSGKAQQIDELDDWDDAVESTMQNEDNLAAPSQGGSSELKRRMRAGIPQYKDRNKTPGDRQKVVKERDKDKKKWDRSA